MREDRHLCDAHRVEQSASSLVGLAGDLIDTLGLKAMTASPTQLKVSTKPTELPPDTRRRSISQL